MITSPIAQQPRSSPGAIGSHSANWRSAFSSVLSRADELGESTVRGDCSHVATISGDPAFMRREVSIDDSCIADLGRKVPCRVGVTRHLSHAQSSTMKTSECIDGPTNGRVAKWLGELVRESRPNCCLVAARTVQPRDEFMRGHKPVMFAGGRDMESEPCERDTDKHDRSSNTETSINAARCVACGEAFQGEGLGSLRSLPLPVTASSARHNPRRGCRPSHVPTRCGRLVSFVSIPRIFIQARTDGQR